MQDVSGIHRLGGTILGTTNRGNPFGTTRRASATEADAYAARCLRSFVRSGSTGSSRSAATARWPSPRVPRAGLPIVGVPKTIDNDIVETTMTFGFDSAVAFATKASIACTHRAAHHRVMVVEVMGRYAGWIALTPAIAGGADAVLIPEIPFRSSRSSRASWRASGSAPGRASSSRRKARSSSEARGPWPCPAPPGREQKLGGIAERVAAEMQARTGKETRFVVLGHLQRGGSRRAATACWRRGSAPRRRPGPARGEFGVMVALQPPDLVPVPLAGVAGRTRTVPPDSDLIRAARGIGIAFAE